MRRRGYHLLGTRESVTIRPEDIALQRGRRRNVWRRAPWPATVYWARIRRLKWQWKLSDHVIIDAAR